MSTVDEILNTVIKALERQIPKEVVIVRQQKTNKPIEFKCPACDKNVLGSGFFCWWCGQHLDWSE